MAKFNFPSYASHVRRIEAEREKRAVTALKPLKQRMSRNLRRQEPPPPPPPPPEPNEPKEPPEPPPGSADRETEDETGSEDEDGEDGEENPASGDDEGAPGQSVASPAPATTVTAPATSTLQVINTSEVTRTVEVTSVAEVTNTVEETNAIMSQTTLSTSFTSSTLASTSVTVSPGQNTKTDVGGGNPTVTVTTTATPSTTSASEVLGAPDSGPVLGPNTTAAIIIGAILGALSMGAVCYLLFRYCAPLKARIRTYRRRRRGSRISDSDDTEDTVSNPDPGPMVQRSFTRVRGMVRFSNSTTATAKGPVPPYAPPGFMPFMPPQNENLNNPFTNQVPPPSRTPSVRSLRSIGTTNTDMYAGTGVTLSSVVDGTYATGPAFIISDYTHANANAHVQRPDHTPGPSHTHTRSRSHNHPTGLMQNPPSLVGRRNESPTTSLGRGVDLNVDMPMSPRSAYSHPIRKSITPSESASNAPASPLPFPAGLTLPPIPATSRWSNNSSSDHVEWPRPPKRLSPQPAGTISTSISGSTNQSPPPVPLKDGGTGRGAAIVRRAPTRKSVTFAGPAPPLQPVEAPSSA